MKTILPIVLIMALWSCSSNTDVKITDSNDYDKYLSSKPAKVTSKYFELWNSKIKPDSMQLTSFGIVAGEYTRFFKETGNITYLKKAEQALKRAVDIAAIGKAGYYRALSRNYISQHRFKEALVWAEKAELLGGGLLASRSLLFDVNMELGNYQLAHSYLDLIHNKEDFGYLIRAAKWQDHKGNLDQAVVLMEKATRKADASNNPELKLWAYTNLADFYGHAGRLTEAYQRYLQALAIDGNNAYAKKGIAWIVFSHEKNPTQALHILDAVTDVNETPDYHILKAEVAAYAHEELKASMSLDAFYQSVQNVAYGDMYNTHKIKFYLDVTGQHDKALVLAKEEVANRATPESYDLLAYTYLKNENPTKALDLVLTHVEGKTFEPEALFHMAEVYKANGAMEKVEKLKKELADASFEMGPEFSEQLASL